jgi:hypothetical protein
VVGPGGLWCLDDLAASRDFAGASFFPPGYLRPGKLANLFERDACEHCSGFFANKFIAASLEFSSSRARAAAPDRRSIEYIALESPLVRNGASNPFVRAAEPQ